MVYMQILAEGTRSTTTGNNMRESVFSRKKAHFTTLLQSLWNSMTAASTWEIASAKKNDNNNTIQETKRKQKGLIRLGDICAQIP